MTVVLSLTAVTATSHCVTLQPHGSYSGTHGSLLLSVCWQRCSAPRLCYAVLLAALRNANIPSNAPSSVR